MHAPSRLSLVRCLTFTAALAAASAASIPPVAAADLPLKTSPGPVVYPSWTGFYFGLHGGWGWGSTHIKDTALGPTFDPIVATYDGPLAGGQIGANWQIGNFVLGAELDGSWTFVQGNTNRDQTIIASSANNNIDFKALATATGRLGYAMGPWLAYVKGGGAWADLDMTTRFTADVTDYHRNPFGAVGGAGIEVAFLRNVSAKLEYNLLYFPTDHLVYVNQNTVSSIDHVVQVVKAGINVRLGGDTVLAR
jgi:opacity protein-like surface antigen